MKQRYIILVLLYLCCSSAVAAQDTTRRAVTLPVITVIQTNSRPESFKAQTPTQVTPSEKMEQLGDAQLSDVLRRMVGVSLKDYGGIGGIKTVSTRGLGSQFSTLTIDGVAVTDCQNGQVDLGRYMLGNSSYISLANGQMDNTLNSAKAYAAGSIINMETHEPEFGARPFNLRLGAEGGSYGLHAYALLRATDWAAHVPLVLGQLSPIQRRLPLHPLLHTGTHRQLLAREADELPNPYRHRRPELLLPHQQPKPSTCQSPLHEWLPCPAGTRHLLLGERVGT